MENVFAATIFTYEHGAESDNIIAYTAACTSLADAYAFLDCDTPSTGRIVAVRRFDASDNYRESGDFFHVHDWDLPYTGGIFRAGYLITHNNATVERDFFPPFTGVNAIF